MENLTERSLGYLLGLLGGALMLLGALIALALGAADLALGHTGGMLGAWSEAVVLSVVGGLALFFAYLGYHGWKDRGLVTGIMLLVIAFLGWGVLGLGSNIAALVGGIFVLLSGILYLVEPAKRVVHEVAASA